MLILLGFFFGIGYWTAAAIHRHEECGESYRWLNQQLLCAGQPVISKAAYIGLRSELLETISNLQKDGKVGDVALFFRDLQNGPTFNINEHEGFVPASLLKVPLMLTYLRLADDDPSLLSRELVFQGRSDNFTQTFPPKEALIAGRSYSLDDLLFRLVAYSDNDAWELLYNYLRQISPDFDLLKETYHELGIIEPEDSADAIITVKSYASIFRILYNASYLSKENSDKALQYLAKSQFATGLREGVPQSIEIAHKFGERFTEDKMQLHDCGVVYYPQNPYLLCVMTEGRDFGDLSLTISLISEAVYEEVDSRRN